MRLIEENIRHFAPSEFRTFERHNLLYKHHRLNEQISGFHEKSGIVTLICYENTL